MIFMVILLFGWSILMTMITIDVMAVYHALLITKPGQFTRIRVCEASARYARKRVKWEYSWLEVSRDSH